jgi:hypothetical protein
MKMIAIRGYRTDGKLLLQTILQLQNIRHIRAQRFYHLAFVLQREILVNHNIE